MPCPPPRFSQEEVTGSTQVRPYRHILGILPRGAPLAAMSSPGNCRAVCVPPPSTASNVIKANLDARAWVCTLACADLRPPVRHGRRSLTIACPVAPQVKSSVTRGIKARAIETMPGIEVSAVLQCLPRRPPPHAEAVLCHPLPLNTLWPS